MDNELLSFALENGILDVTQVQQMKDMKERKLYLENHPYKIWQSNKGYWYTYVSFKDGTRKQLSRRHKEDLENDIVHFYKQEEENPTISVQVPYAPVISILQSSIYAGCRRPS